MFYLKLFIAFCLFYCVNGARILAVIPTPSYSHQVVFRQIWKDLSRRGHDLTILTTDPMNDPDLKIREINLSKAYEIWNGLKVINKVKEHGINIYGIYRTINQAMQKVVTQELENPEVQNLLNSNEKFDLVIVEFFHPVMFAFSAKYNCPYIGVASLDLTNLQHNVFDNPIHPVLYPDFGLPFDGKLNFVERIISAIYYCFTKVYVLIHGVDEEDAVVRKYFGEETPSLKEIIPNVSMVFLNTNPALNLRPMGPAFISIGGGSHIEALKPLPKDLKEYLDNAPEGVIYFSLGTNVKSNTINPELLKVFLDTFKDIKYNVLWKFDAEIPKLPKNVKIIKWCPQPDVLRHPNVKAFITQGGLQSFEEAIVSQVPMVGIPFIVDQLPNCVKMVNRGLGVKLDKDTMTKTDLRKAILEVINNPSYKERIIKIDELSRDQPMTGTEKAVWWTEYVIRHKGAKHFRNHVVDMPFYEYYMLDVLAVFLSIFTVFGLSVRLVVKTIGNLIKKNTKKIKNN